MPEPLSPKKVNRLREALARKKQKEDEHKNRIAQARNCRTSVGVEYLPYVKGNEILTPNKLMV